MYSEDFTYSGLKSADFPEVEPGDRPTGIIPKVQELASQTGDFMPAPRNYSSITRNLINEYDLDNLILSRIRGANGTVWAVVSGYTEDYDWGQQGGHYHFLLKLENDEWVVEVETDLRGYIPDFSGQTLPLYASESGEVWFGFGAQLFKYENGSVVTYNHENSSIPVIEELQDRPQIADIAGDGNGNIYAITWDYRLVAFEGEEWLLYDESNSSLIKHLGGNPRNADRMIAVDGEEIWIANASVEYGLFHRSSSGEWHHYAEEDSDLPSNLVSSVVIQAPGHIWAGTWPRQEHYDSATDSWNGGGLVEIDNGSWTIYTVDEGLPENSDNHVWARAVEDQEELWITYGNEMGILQGLAVYDADSEWHVLYETDSAFDPNYTWINSMDTVKDLKWLLGMVSRSSTDIVQWIFNIDESAVQFVESPEEGYGYDAGTEVDITWIAGRRVENVAIESSQKDHQFSGVSGWLDAGSDSYTYTFPAELTLDSEPVKILDEYSMRIITDGDTFAADTAGYFSVIDRDNIQYHLRNEYTATNMVELYEIGTHNWSFDNAKETMWTEQDYEHIEYGSFFSNFPFNAVPADFPSWGMMQSAFGDDELRNDLGLYKARALLTWRIFKSQGYQGVCHAFAVTSLVGFVDGINGLSTFGIETNGHQKLYEIEPTVNNKHALHTVWMRQWGRDHLFGQLINALSDNVLQTLLDPNITLADLVDTETYFGSPNETLADIKAMLNTPGPDAYHNHLVLISPDNISGAHTIMAYRAEENPSNPDIWDVYVYENNQPGNDTLKVQIDTEQDYWWYDTPKRNEDGEIVIERNYEGTHGLFLGDRVDGYRTESSFKAPGQVSASEGINFEDLGYQYVLFGPGSSAAISDTLGYTTSFSGTELANGITGALPIVPDAGEPAAPYGFFLLDNEVYEVDISYESDVETGSFMMANQNHIYNYTNRNPAAGQTDRLRSGNSFSVLGSSNGSSVEFDMAVIEEHEDSDRFYNVVGASVANGDSMQFRMEENAELLITNYGDQQSVHLELIHAYGDDYVEFSNFELNGSAALKLQPEWDDLLSGNMTVQIDTNLDGEYDQSRSETGNVTTSSEIENYTEIPENVMLAQNYPNPFNPVTTIRYELPMAGDVRLEVFDLLGRRVAVLVDGLVDAGMHRVQFDASHLASGVYLYRLTAGGFVQTRQMVLVK